MTTDEENFDALLEETEKEFTNPPVRKAKPSSQDCSSKDKTNSILSEEDIQRMTREFEASIRDLRSQQIQKREAENKQCETSSFVDVKVLKDELSNIIGESMTTGGSGAKKDCSDKNDSSSKDNFCEDDTNKDIHSLLMDAFNQIGESGPDLQADFDPSKLDSLLGGLGENGDLMTTMQSMLENILSKDILYEPLKEISCKFPGWLAEHQSSLSEQDFSKYSKQFAIMKQVVDMFDSEKESDTKQTKDKRFQDMLEMMQQLQGLGSLPPELVNEAEYPPPMGLPGAEQCALM